MKDKTKKYLLLILSFLVLVIYACIESQNKGDLTIYLEAAKDLFSGGNIYENKYIDGYHFFYSVLFAIIVFPLSFLPIYVANFIWICLNLFLVWRIFLLIKNLLPLHNFNRNELMFLRISGFVFSVRFIHENIHCMQVTIILLFLCLKGLQLIFSNKPLYGAALIALGINIKLLPLVLVPYLIYRGFFKAAFATILFYVLLLFLPALAIGWEFNQTLLSTWKNLINPANAAHVLDTEERSFHGLSTLLSTLLVKNVPDIYALPLKRNIADISTDSLNIILNLTRLFFVGLTLVFLRTKPFTNNVNMLHRFREISYILLLIPLIFPHQQHYNFLFICPAFVYCMHYFVRNKTVLEVGKKNILIVLSIIVFFLCSLKLIAGAYNAYFEHYKILTYGAILLIGLLMLCNDDEAEFTSKA